MQRIGLPPNTAPLFQAKAWQAGESGLALEVRVWFARIARPPAPALLVSHPFRTGRDGGRV